jgi:hypothetical protein
VWEGCKPDLCAAFTGDAQKPMPLVITAGLRGFPQFQVVLDRIRVPRLGPGRPRTRPDKVRADKLAVRYEATVLVTAINGWL